MCSDTSVVAVSKFAQFCKCSTYWYLPTPLALANLIGTCHPHWQLPFPLGVAILIGTCHSHWQLPLPIGSCHSLDLPFIGNFFPNFQKRISRHCYTLSRWTEFSQFSYC